MAATALPLEDQAEQPKKAPEMEQKALTLADEARALRVADQQSYETAAEKLKGVVTLRKEIQDYHRPLKQAAHEAHRRICDAEAGMLKPVEEAERILKGSISQYEAEQEYIRQEEARRLREEEERRQAEAIEAQIEEAEAQGASVEEIEAIATQPVIAPPVVVPKPVQPVAGVSTRETWKAQVTDKKLFVQAVAKDPGRLLQLVEVNQTALNQLAKALRSGLQIPGVRVYPEKTVAVRGR